MKKIQTPDVFTDKAEAYIDFPDDERIYYEPPDESDNNCSQICRTVINDAPAFQREDSVYENCEVEKGVVKMGNGSEPLGQVQSNNVENSSDGLSKNKDLSSNCSDKKSLTQRRECPSYKQVTENGRNEHVNSVKDIQKPMTDLTNTSRGEDEDHVYINGNVNHNLGQFYVTPKHHYSQGERTACNQLDNEDRIYDVPK